MLSAVENHFAPSRLYATGAHHPYSSNSAVAIGANSNFAAPCPIVALPTPMSATEFARPHPKPNRYNGSQSLRNGLSSPSSRSKYSQLDQSAPVNLAVSQSMPDNGALVLNHKPSDRDVAALCAAAKPSSLESEQDAISSSIASLYQHKMPYCPPHSIPDAATPLYYPNFYARPTTGSVYGHSIYAAPSSHALGGARNPLHHGVATYPHVDSYSNPYLFGPNAYSPPAAARPNLSPHSPIGTITVGSASQNSNNTSISAQSVLPANASPLSVSPPSMFTQQQHQQHQQQQQQHQREQREQHQQQYHLKPEHNTSVAKPLSTYRTEAKEKESTLSNGKAADFKIPSGKEGSLKHRILTRPTYGDKEATAKQTQKQQQQQQHQQQSLPTHSQNNVVTKSSVKIKNNNTSNSNNHNGNSSNSSSSSNNNNNASSKNKNLGNSSGNGSGSSSNNSTNFSKGTLIELSNGELKRVEDMRTEDFITSSSKNPNLQLIDTTVVKMTSQSKNKVLITLSFNNNKICMDTQPSHPFFVYGKGWSSFSPDETLHDYGLKCHSLEIGDVCISLKPREQHQRTMLDSSSSSSSSSSSITSPQNLSRKQMPHTISTTATGTAVTSRPIPSFEPSYMHHRHPNELIYGHHHARPLNPDTTRNYSTTMAPPPPPSSNSESSSSNSYDDEAIDATMHSRKRRAWSVPENHCDDQKKSKPN